MRKTTFLLLLLTFCASSTWAQTVDYANITPEQLPAGTKVIPAKAFRSRNDLVEVTIPEGVEIIEANAFSSCYNLSKVTLPSTLIRAKGAFSSCSNLKDVTCLSIVPPSLKAEPSYLTVNLTQYSSYDAVLDAIQWDNGYGTCSWFVYDETDIDQKILEIIQLIKQDPTWGAVKTPNLKFTSFNYGLYNYSTRKDYTVRDNVWPYDDVVYLNYMMRDHTLTHPACTPYEMETGWNHFPAFKTLDQPLPTKVRVGTDYTLRSNPFTNKPDLTLAVSMDNDQSVYYAGHMSALDGSFSFGTFNLEQDAWENNNRILKTSAIYAPYIDRTFPTLYTEAPMRADVVKTTWRLNYDIYRQGRGGAVVGWIFASLPFDCRLSDLRASEGGTNLQWVIYKHSGQMRADAKFNDVWVKQTTDSILHAGEGFIFACGWNNWADPTVAIEFPAINNANKNRLFTTEDVSIPLHQYPASAESNRSWNFIGNPYPCFYSTKYFEPSMPFVVYQKTWNPAGSYYMGYKTYSPVDDDYLLSPFQAFFVQRPLGAEALNFPEYGRFVTVDEYEDLMGQLIDVPGWYQGAEPSEVAQHRVGRRKVAAPRPPVGTMENRRVINLLLQDAEGTELDRTRLVGNPDASIDYESVCDATKFPDLTDSSTLLYIIDADDTHYAISEQPFAEGDEVSLGAKFPTAGTYTLQANFKAFYPDLDGKVMLIDYETGTIQPATEPYTFTAQAGETTTRFALSYGNEATGVSSVATSSQHSGQTYDLQGRLVKGTPRPGIYIKNGKKIIIK